MKLLLSFICLIGNNLIIFVIQILWGDCLGVEIRHAKLEDYKYISNISKELHTFHIKNRPDVYKEVNKTIYKSYYKELLDDDNVEIIVITRDKKVVGYTIIRYIEIKNIDLLQDKFFAYIDEICIDEKNRREGFGRMLFEYSYDLVKFNGAESLELGVWSFNEKAIGFYKAMGMVEKNIRMEKKWKSEKLRR